MFWLDFRENVESLCLRESPLSHVEREEDVGLQDKSAGHLENIEGACPKGRCIPSGELLRTGVRLDRHRREREHAAAVLLEIPEDGFCLCFAYELSKDGQLDSIHQFELMKWGED